MLCCLYLTDFVRYVNKKLKGRQESNLGGHNVKSEVPLPRVRGPLDSQAIELPFNFPYRSEAEIASTTMFEAIMRVFLIVFVYLQKPLLRDKNKT